MPSRANAFALLRSGVSRAERRHGPMPSRANAFALLRSAYRETERRHRAATCVIAPGTHPAAVVRRLRAAQTIPPLPDRRRAQRHRSTARDDAGHVSSAIEIGKGD